ncbi:helix-turn-helix domain-containing protein [Mesorhizobium sp. CA14]|uniref:helix-turn-helix domain-containing protein n=1 Tax=Mesorhizobium sp. CA14 TaxID=2876642 RepID=UPI001CCBD850|nr:helix-turn-helix domain-containing protein [Mesorhizobium sp. CA14]MBZ9850307.1 helix-turn-helix domain-containing protein [Mesorhizobium sp. CA14]
MKPLKTTPEAALRAGLLKLASAAAVRAGTDASEFLPHYGTKSSKRYRRNELLSTKEAAVVLKISLKTLQNWRVTGHGPQYVKIGSAVSYRYGDLLVFIRRNTHSSTSEGGGR